MRQLKILLPLLIANCAIATTPPTASGFSFPNEKTLFTAPNPPEASSCWLNRAVIENGEVKPTRGNEWTEAVFKFHSSIEVTAQPLVMYYSMRTHGGEDYGAAYMQLRFTEDSHRREQLRIVLTARPSPRWYMFYLDIGFQVPSPVEYRIKPPSGQFATPETLEHFRITVRRDQTHILATADTWDPKTETWVSMPNEINPAESCTLRISIKDHLEGNTSLKSVGVQFPQDAAAVSNIRIARLPE